MLIPFVCPALTMTWTEAVALEVDVKRTMTLAPAPRAAPVAVSTQVPIEKICPMLVTCTGRGIGSMRLESAAVRRDSARCASYPTGE